MEHSLDIFDGVALAASVVCLFLTWAYYRLHRREQARGSVLMAWAMGLGALAWMLSLQDGAFARNGGSEASVAVLLSVLLANACLVVGFFGYVTRGRVPWKAFLLATLGLFAVAGTLRMLFGPHFFIDTALAIVFASCAAFCLKQFIRKPTEGYLPIAVAFLSHPFLLILALEFGFNVEKTRQLLGLSFALTGVMVLLVGFLRSSAVLQKQMRKIQAADAHLRELVYVDASTGLRSALGQRERIAQLMDEQVTFSLLALNLDNFRIINDNLGPAGGNAVIVQAAQVIGRALDGKGELARNSGAGYTVVLPGLVEPASLRAVAQDILFAMRHPLEYGAAKVYVTMSIGISRSPMDAKEVDELMRVANVALHDVKLRGGNGVSAYEPFMDDDSRDKLWLDQHLRDALEHGQFSLHYQPKLLLHNQCATSVEALIRWQHPERGNIRPDQFIARAEATGLIVPIGRWVIQTAAQQAAAWSAQGLAARIAVNLSLKQLADEGLMDTLQAAQTLAQGLLDIELTESSLSDNEAQMLEFIAQCRALGFGVHLDDFGTGYSSLSRLGNLPLTKIKLDRSFVTPIGQSAKADALVRAMVAIGNELSLQIVAEGVETAEQADFLLNLGVRYAQGWLYAPAMDPVQCEAWLRENTRASLLAH